MKSFQFFTIVRERTASIIERWGKYHGVLSPGIHFIVPIMDSIAYRHTLKEQAISIENQFAITKDNVTVAIDGTLFVKIEDPYKASYKIEKPLESVKLLALTVMRSEIGKMKLDKLFQERNELNQAINEGVNSATEAWGLKCLRYEILNIDPPNEIKKSMQYEAEAQRQKRRDILISEGQQLADINIADGQRISQVKRAEGDAEAMKKVAIKEAEAIENVAKSLQSVDSEQTLNYILMQRYIKKFQNMILHGQVLVTPESKGTQQGGSGSDLMNVAALLSMNNYSSGQPKPLSQFDQHQSNYSNSNPFSTQNTSSNSSQGSMRSDHYRDDTYKDLLRKSEFYDDPQLYSSDDEMKKKSSSKSSNLKDNDIFTTSKNFQSQELSNQHNNYLNFGEKTDLNDRSSAANSNNSSNKQNPNF